MSSFRRPGDPIPASLVRLLRDRLGLTQEGLAERLGVKGGKSTISGWENEHAKCEGPAAEFILTLLGTSSGPMKLRSLEADIDRRWSVANQNNKAWRQISIAPDSDYVIDRDAFLRLLPEAALTEEEHAHRFPFTEVNGRPVYGFVDQSWQGAIPNTPEEPPSYLWRLQRDGGFAYRERLWEVDQILDPPYGHVILGSLFDIAVPALAFYSRVARVWQPRMDLLISMELHGIRNRGIAFDLGSDRPSFGGRRHASGDPLSHPHHHWGGREGKHLDCGRADPSASPGIRPRRRPHCTAQHPP
jgi:transcriptional regulator with XRE-family HTH domain